MKEVTINIDGMTCSACSSGVERSLSRKPYIQSVNVNLINKSANIVYDEQSANVDNIFENIKKLGYTPSLPSQKAQDEAKIGFLSKIENSLLTPKRRVIIASVFSVLTIWLSMFSSFTPHFVDPYNEYLQLFFTLIVMHMGRNFYFVGFRALFGLTPNMSTLIAIGTSSAFIYSLGYFFGIGELYFEGVCTIITFVLIGKTIEENSKTQAKKSLEKLARVMIREVIRIQEGKEETIDIQDIKVGDLIKILPGQTIALDGIIEQGESNIDNSSITGESIPIYKKVGDEVNSGGINLSEPLIIKSTKTAKDSTLQQIISIVQNSINSKPSIATLADKVALYFVPFVIIWAILVGIIWLFIGDSGIALEYFIAVLVVSCPCAFGIATPMALMVGTKVASQNGIFFKDAQVLEKANSISVAIFDKTGTITNSNPTISKIESFVDGVSQEDILRLCAGLESGAHHSIADAIIKKAKELNLEIPKAVDFKNKIGSGVEAKIDGVRYFAGNKDMFANGEKIQKQAQMCVFFGKEDQIWGVIYLIDEIKDDAKTTIEKLKKRGIRSILLSGDNKENVERVAREVGINEFFYECKPHQKLEKIQELKDSGESVMMVGDGINDAPSLAMADISIAMGSGSDIAIAASNIVILNNKLENIALAINIGHKSIKNIKENLFWAFGYNVAMIPIASGVMAGFGIVLTPMMASLAMVLSSVSVVINTQRIRKVK